MTGDKMRQSVLALCILLIGSLACSGQTDDFPTPGHSIFDDGHTTYGFFPSPPEATLDSVLNHFKSISQHADFVLVQPNVAWEEFTTGIEGESQKRTDVINQVKLARQNGLDAIFVVDPLNGLNRREFMALPAGWEANFANPTVRTAFTNFSLWVVRHFHPRYLGLASEINTYMDAHPEDAPNYLSLYKEVYAAVKAEAPETQIFVTFQWEDLNNLFDQPEEGDRQPYVINWDQVEAFEPDLDIWVISSYPFVAFQSGAQIPDGYYTPLLTRTSKPLAVAEGGYTSRPVGPFAGAPEDQVAYLNALHDQIGERLDFWVYLLLNDFNLDSYSDMMRSQGQGDDDVNTLGMFASVGLRDFDGSPKPAMEVWDSFRNNP
jgi:hypothetical protein